MKVSLSTLNQTPLNWHANLENLKEVFAKSIADKSDLLVTPELSLTGYGCMDMFLEREFLEKTLDYLVEFVRFTKGSGLNVIVGAPVLGVDGKVYNCAILIKDGKICEIIPKTHLAIKDVHYESRWFEPAKSRKVEVSSSKLEGLFIEKNIFYIKGYKIGLEICEDLWHDDAPHKQYKRENCSLIINTSASCFMFTKKEELENILKRASKDVTYIYTNLLGLESGSEVFNGKSYIYKDSNKNVETEGFYLDNNHVETIEIGEDKKIYKELNRYEEFEKIQTLAVLDTLRKTKTKGFVISSSGGRDSALNIYLIKIALNKAIEYFGEQKFKERFSLDTTNLKEIVKTCYQKTDCSSQETENAAENIAKVLGVDFTSVNVQKLVDNYIELFYGKKELDWDKDSIALQNIQARVRSPGVWMISNLENKILVTTSNRSEVAVGYTTMEGDTCGGVSFLGSTSKNFILEYIENQATPIHEILKELEPSAELKPEKQEDQEELMPFDVLEILESNPLTQPQKNLNQIKSRLGDKYNKEDLIAWTKRFYRLWCRNQWKRIKFSNTILIQKDLAPHGSTRFPLLNGGLEDELETLK